MASIVFSANQVGLDAPTVAGQGFELPYNGKILAGPLGPKCNAYRTKASMWLDQNGLSSAFRYKHEKRGEHGNYVTCNWNKLKILLICSENMFREYLLYYLGELLANSKALNPVIAGTLAC